MIKFVELQHAKSNWRKLSICVEDIKAVTIEEDGETTVVTSAIRYPVYESYETVMLRIKTAQATPTA